MFEYLGLTPQDFPANYESFWAWKRSLTQPGCNSFGMPKWAWPVFWIVVLAKLCFYKYLRVNCRSSCTYLKVLWMEQNHSTKSVPEYSNTAECCFLAECSAYWLLSSQLNALERFAMGSVPSIFLNPWPRESSAFVADSRTNAPPKPMLLCLYHNCTSQGP